MDLDEAQPAGPTPSASGSSGEPAASTAASGPKARKRTKTGCLTCRKRRIKCGEERPTCVNCIKSKRHCDGYNQRIVFKPPNSWADGLPGNAFSPTSNPAAQLGSHSALAHALPLPANSQPVTLLQRPLYGIPIDESGRRLIDPTIQQLSPFPPELNSPAGRFEAGSTPFDQSPTGPFSPSLQTFASATSVPAGFSVNDGPQSPQDQYDLPIRSPEYPSSLPSGQLDQARLRLSDNGLPIAPDPEARPSAWEAQENTAGVFSQDGFVYAMQKLGATNVTSNYVAGCFAQPRGISRSFDGAPLNVGAAAFGSQHPIFMASATTPLDLNEAAIQYDYSDYASTEPDDVISDLDIELPPDEAVSMNQDHFTLMNDIRNNYSSETTIRSYNTYLYTGMLRHHDPDRDSSTLDSQHNIWTYTLPAMALNHNGLLHGMLAVSSLHISKLQNGPVTPSFKHYAYAIKRMRHCLVERERRHLPSTLAATLLLGFYEVITADHSKWTSHLKGASQLLKEINFRWLAHQFNSLAQKSSDYGLPHDAGDPLDIQQQAPSSLDLDYDLIRQLTGGSGSDKSIRPDSDSFDAQRYLLYQDLFWWYAKQDVYQSIISGNRLLLNYSRWSDCPPRAAVGRTDALYGTQDHLMLILARIADFAAKDRPRKLRVMEANGGHWSPPPGPPFGHPQSAEPSGPAEHREPPQLPPFFGMAPVPEGVSMPASYQDLAHTPPYESPKSSEPPDDLQAETNAALQVWQDMHATLLEFEKRIASALSPLPPDIFPPTNSPFGESLVYASYETSVIWSFYYAAHILLLRGHPHMPPPALAAAAAAVAQTAPYVERIGRIAAGMMPNGLPTPLTPEVGAALCEATIPLFIAGVQLSNRDQRVWLVERLRDLNQRSGWASIGLIAAGCETAWERADAVRKMPPYLRSTPRRVVLPVPPPDIEVRWQVKNPDGSHPLNEHDFRLHHAAGLIGAPEVI